MLAQPPVITTSPSDAYVAIDKAHTLRCSYDSSSTATVYWYRNGHKILTQFDDPGSQYSLAGTGDLFLLKFKNQDVGLYYCNVTNQYGSTISSNGNLQLSGM